MLNSVVLGAKLLLYGLCSNTTVRSLDLKGNNLRAVGAEALGRLLRQNGSIQSLTLEWNNLGTWEEGFSALCAGLGVNPALRRLDLRNNQIDHRGAEELAAALRANSRLQELDLRWNNVGLLGGRALARCLPANRTLRRLELAGNNVPGDVLAALAQATGHNEDRQGALREKQIRTRVLSREVRSLKEEKAKQFLDLMETIDKQRDELGRSNRSWAGRVDQLQEALNERHSITNSLKAKLQMSEAALTLSEQKLRDLGDLLSASKRDQASLSERHSQELKLERQGAAERESRLLQDLAAASEKNLLLRNQVDELEGRSKAQQDLLFQTKEELTHTTANLKLRLAQAQEHLEAEKKRFKQGLEESESLRLKEVAQVTRQMEEAERALQERVQRLEAVRISLEEELSGARAALMTERGRAEEELVKARNQARLEEQQRLAHLEEKLRLLGEARDQAQACCLQQKQALDQARAQARHLGLQEDSWKRRLDLLQQELSDKEREKVAEVNKARVELQEQIGHLQAERATREGLKEKIAALERQLKVMSDSHREALLDRESESVSLREKLRLKEAEFSRLREEEAQRARLLHTAVMAYVQGSPLGVLGPRR
ncbi:leucine-rich repeat-containing protein 45 isoform X2 [Ornithorhynchus anatinus]|uniref:leucine-rich repeat-containing protein 45 isoform X2 n=1 Tax=Ornithorhynchus anatinus TaxID=9258 RepID=UPI0010A8E525|nr:leucine-rich repeat-containing protein 45 isoform X2 [Ornithorhynchus anatinus]